MHGCTDAGMPMKSSVRNRQFFVGLYGIAQSGIMVSPVPLVTDQSVSVSVFGIYKINFFHYIFFQIRYDIFPFFASVEILFFTAVSILRLRFWPQGAELLVTTRVFFPHVSYITYLGRYCTVKDTYFLSDDLLYSAICKNNNTTLFFHQNAIYRPVLDVFQKATKRRTRCTVGALSITCA